jgi:hypothetical protein
MKPRATSPYPERSRRTLAAFATLSFIAITDRLDLSRRPLQILTRAHGFLSASGWKSFCPAISYSPIACCPAGEASQSANC